MKNVEREIEVISEKGWGGWDYKAVVVQGNKSHVVYCLAHIRPSGF